MEGCGDANVGEGVMPQQKPGESKQDYQTPKAFIKAAEGLLGISRFMCDLAAEEHNTISPSFISPEMDSLSEQWDWEVFTKDGWGWLNPPYSKIGPWAEKCHLSAQKGAKVALLVPASVGANWYRDFIHNKAYTLFLNGRLAFMPDQPNWLYPKDLILVLFNGWAVGSNVWDWKV